jgi:hypothetical protein
MLVGGQKPVPEAMGNSPDEKMDTESTNGVELCRVSLKCPVALQCGLGWG